VSRLEPGQQPHRDLAQLAQRHPPAPAVDHLEQREPAHLLHHQRDDAVVRHGVEHRHHVRVGPAGHDPTLAQEPPPDPGVADQVRVQDLDRDRPLERVVQGGEHDAHAALADPGAELVLAEAHPGAKHRGHRDGLARVGGRLLVGPGGRDGTTRRAAGRLRRVRGSTSRALHHGGV
jgi:hypothetical protein